MKRHGSGKRLGKDREKCKNKRRKGSLHWKEAKQGWCSTKKSKEDKRKEKTTPSLPLPLELLLLLLLLRVSSSQTRGRRRAAEELWRRTSLFLTPSPSKRKRMTYVSLQTVAASEDSHEFPSRTIILRPLRRLLYGS